MRTATPLPSRTSVRLLAAAAVLAVAGGLAACAPETESTASPSPDTTPTASASPTPAETSAATPTATPTPAPSEDIALPASCDELYSAGMRGTLDADVPPLNDPGITMTSTENAAAIAILDAAPQKLRCTWGLPSEVGLATTVVIVTSDEAATLAETFANQGFSTSETAGGTVYETRRETIDFDDNLVAFGESHFLRGNGWVATRWINYEPSGLTADIAASLWG